MSTHHTGSGTSNDDVQVSLPSTQSNRRYLDLDPDKLRGGFYTSQDIADWICSWAIRTKDDLVLEPSCGDGVFIDSIGWRLTQLGTLPTRVASQIRGVDIVQSELVKAATRLSGHTDNILPTTLTHSDFFDWASIQQSRFDAVVGNPPFIRYQSFPEPYRTRAMEMLKELGLRPNRLTNIWVPFVAVSTSLLSEGGRLGLVLPAELLQVSYATQLRNYLLNEFQQVNVVACNELLFDSAEQEVVILLCEGAHTSESEQKHDVRFAQRATRTELIATPAEDTLSAAEPKSVDHDNEKWLKYFLTQREIDALRELRESDVTTTLGDRASVNVGVVTGKNAFFVLDKQAVEEWALEDFVLPLVGKASQVRGATLEESDWSSLSETGQRVYLLQLGDRPLSQLPKGARAYVRSGEKAQFHLGYKCSIRSPWYLVPSVGIPDAFLFRQIFDFPRVVVNRTGATSTDTIHRLNVLPGFDVNEVAAGMYTSLTAASAEIEGRSYGGGVLELEPTEAGRLLIPTSGNGLSIDEVNRLLADKDLEDIIHINDALLLKDAGVSEREIQLLQSAWTRLRTRRHSRNRSRTRVDRPKRTSRSL